MRLRQDAVVGDFLLLFVSFTRYIIRFLSVAGPMRELQVLHVRRVSALADRDDMVDAL